MSKETLSTSEKEVPKIKLGLQDKYEEEKKELPPETEALNPDNIGQEVGPIRGQHLKFQRCCGNVAVQDFIQP